MAEKVTDFSEAILCFFDPVLNDKYLQSGRDKHKVKRKDDVMFYQGWIDRCVCVWIWDSIGPAVSTQAYERTGLDWRFKETDLIFVLNYTYHLNYINF